RTNRGSARAILDIREKRDRDLITRRRGNQHTLQLIDVITEIASISNTDRVTLPAFDCTANRVPADRSLDDLVDVIDLQAVPSCGLTVRRKIQEVTAGGSLRKRAAGVRKIRERFLDRYCDILN